jgi:hypothetical protein
MAPSVPSRLLVSPEAKGKARLLFQEAQAGADRMEAAFARIPKQLLRACERKGATGSERAILKIRASMPRLPDLDGIRLVLWRYLAVLPAMPDDETEPPQPCLAVRVILAQHRKPSRGGELFGLIVSRHAVERAYQRAHDLDVHRAIFAAHDALLVLESEGEQVFALPRFPLPCAGGLFLTHTRHVGAARSPVAICDTFVTDDMTYADQDRDAAEWRRLIQISRREHDAGVQPLQRRQSA